MTTVTVELTDEQARQLTEEAERLRLPMQEVIAQRLFADWQPSEQNPEEAHGLKFEDAMNYVFEKNAELYRRLA